MRTIVFWALYWGPPILGNYHFGRYRDSGPNNGEPNMEKRDMPLTP